jgi:hypothetical protein
MTGSICRVMLRNISGHFQAFSLVGGCCMQHACDMGDDDQRDPDDPTWSKMIGAIARSWAADKYRRDKQFHKTALYEALVCYVTLRRMERPKESESEVVAEAASTYGVSEATVWRAVRHVKKMHATVKTAVS